MREPIARLVKDGQERLVHTRAELVELRYNGWREITKVAEHASGAVADLAHEFYVTGSDEVSVPDVPGAQPDDES